MILIFGRTHSMMSEDHTTNAVNPRPRSTKAQVCDTGRQGIERKTSDDRLEPINLPGPQSGGARYTTHHRISVLHEESIRKREYCDSYITARVPMVRTKPTRLKDSAASVGRSSDFGAGCSQLGLVLSLNLLSFLLEVSQHFAHSLTA